MYYNYESSDDEWPEVRYRRLATNKKSFPTNQNIFDLGESKLGIDARYFGSIGKADIQKPGSIEPNTKSASAIAASSATTGSSTTGSKFTDAIDRPYIARDGNRRLAAGQYYKWANQSADMFNTNMNTNIDARVTRFVTEKTPFTYAAARMQEYGGNDRPNYISPLPTKYCKGVTPGLFGCTMAATSKKEHFSDAPEHFTDNTGHMHTKCCQHNNDIGVIIDVVTSPLFLMILLLVILAYVVELLRNVREMLVAIHHSAINTTK